MNLRLLRDSSRIFWPGVGLLAASATLIIVSLFTGCAAFGGNSGQNTVVNATIEFATAKYIERSAGNDATRRLNKAVEVKAVATQIQGLASGTVTLAQLDTALASSIGKLSPSDQLLANALVQVLLNEVNVKIQTGILTAAEAAAVKTIAQDVILATTLYGA